MADSTRGSRRWNVLTSGSLLAFLLVVAPARSADQPLPAPPPIPAGQQSPPPEPASRPKPQSEAPPSTPDGDAKPVENKSAKDLRGLQVTITAPAEGIVNQRVLY